MITQLLPLLALLPGLLHAQVIPFTLDGALDKVRARSNLPNLMSGDFADSTKRLPPILETIILLAESQSMASTSLCQRTCSSSSQLPGLV
jgi:hypothetical protein